MSRVMTRPERDRDTGGDQSSCSVEPAEEPGAHSSDESSTAECSDERHLTREDGTERGASAAAGDAMGRPVPEEDVREAAESTDDQPRLTVAAVARRLGIAPATLRTWDRRYGLGPSDHATGRHRRYGPADIARLELMQHALLRGASPAEAARYARTSPPRAKPAEEADATPGGVNTGGSAPAEDSARATSGQVPPTPDAAVTAVPSTDDVESDSGDAGPTEGEPMLWSGVLASGRAEPFGVANTGGRGLRLAGAGPRARGLGHAALALDASSALELLRAAIATDGVVHTWENTLSPVLRAIAERRQRTGSGIEVQQLLVDCASTALRSVIAEAPAPRNPRPVVLAPVPGEAQGLELVALTAALAARGVRHLLFGAALPSEGLAAAVRRSAPAAVVLWAEQEHQASPRVLREVPITRQRGWVFAAGSGWSPATVPGSVERLAALGEAVSRISETMRAGSDANHNS